MGNLLSTKLPIGSPGRAPMLRSVFELRQITKGMQQLSCDVVFGSPSADCLGTGVCKISALGVMPGIKSGSRDCARAPGILAPIDGGAGVSMVFAREMMCTKLLRNQFRKGVLTLESSYRLPATIISALALRIRTLKKGEYRVEEVDGFIRINFR
ncbi:MAG: hypothetical protein H6576_11065 [Lewinellaceae bacterium]|nr:hypothetical protein [Saprospiraceae bacterium]MCB9344231.1 hypothetical protein [Lewinellaceae bacterium]